MRPPAQVSRISNDTVGEEQAEDEGKRAAPERDAGPDRWPGRPITRIRRPRPADPQAVEEPPGGATGRRRPGEQERAAGDG